MTQRTKHVRHSACASGHRSHRSRPPSRLAKAAGLVLAALLAVAACGSPDAVLAACFQNGLPLLAFDRSEPTLRDVFLRLVGPEKAAEVLA